ncbi:hypothetical protein [uncultured Tolumonas sp.]|uniref:hypothetical protein n=1 Tax=uncultured Tolumonas sp. TaxID=263765 RepID=UPI0029316B16|nr:hypothetical protein [uncultured Tolumonas sp.]
MSNEKRLFNLLKIKNSQNIIVKYMEEYALSEHFIKYFINEFKDKTILDVRHSNEFDDNELLQLIFDNEEVKIAINGVVEAENTKDYWSFELVSECLHSIMKISIDMNNINLKKELLAYFNMKNNLSIDKNNDNKSKSDKVNAKQSNDYKAYLMMPR